MEYFSCSFLKSVRDFTIEIKKVLIYNLSVKKYRLQFVARYRRAVSLL